MVLILVSIAMTIIEITVDLTPSQAHALLLADRVLLVFFALEIGLRVATFRPPDLDLFALSPAGRLRAGVLGRIGYCFRPMVFIDLLALLALVPALRALRALRLLRLLRTARLFRYANPFTQLGAAVQDNALLYLFALGILAVETVVGGVTMYLIEGRDNPDVSSVWDGMWWTIVTLTTVGYGDVTPLAALGRGWAGVLMVAGMFTLALFAGVVGHTLLHTVLTLREEQFRMTRYSEHIVVLGWTPGAQALLDALHEELDGTGRELVLFGPGDRPSELSASARWISGDPSKEAELDKVHITRAHTVIFTGQRTMTIPQADASTILGIFTLRSYLAKHAEPPRKTPVHVVAEILDPENVEHARVAGANEVVESARLGFALLAHTVVQHGTADVMSRVVSAGAHSMYVGRADAFVGQRVFDAGRALKQQHDVLLLGLRQGMAGADHLNPPDDLLVRPEHVLLYLATGPVLPSPDDTARVA